MQIWFIFCFSTLLASLLGQLNFLDGISVLSLHCVPLSACFICFTTPIALKKYLVSNWKDSLWLMVGFLLQKVFHRSECLHLHVDGWRVKKMSVGIWEDCICLIAQKDCDILLFCSFPFCSLSEGLSQRHHGWMKGPPYSQGSLHPMWVDSAILSLDIGLSLRLPHTGIYLLNSNIPEIWNCDLGCCRLPQPMYPWWLRPLILVLYL